MIKIANVKIAFHVHATEDEHKVLKALKNVLPSGIKIELERDVYIGYYGNRIIRYEGLVKDSTIAMKIFKYIFSSLEELPYSSWIEDHFDSKEQTLYLRLDKQYAFLGEVRIVEGSDIIHLVFKFHKYAKFSIEELEAYIKKVRKRMSE